MNVLVFCDDRWHPGQTVKTGLDALAGDEFEFDYIEDARQWTAERMAGYPVVVLSKSNNVSSSDHSNWMTEDAQRAFVDYVRSGHGLLAIHSGTAEYQEAAALRALLGGVFVQHPKQCPVTVTASTGHPLAQGYQTFTEKDEHYFMALDDDGADVFLTSASEHGEQPAGWTRTDGSGRVCVLTPGHNVAVWLHPSYQAVIANALRWCAAAGGVDVAGEDMADAQ